MAALACVLAGALAVIRLHTLHTGLDPVRDAVSDYGTTPVHLFYRFQVAAFGIGALLLTFALRDAGDFRAGGLVWLAIYAGARIAIAAFMTDRPGSPATGEGRVHRLLATVAFTSIAVAASTVGSDLGGGYAALGWAVAGCSLATLVFAVAPPLRRWFGAIERLLYVATAAWLAVVAVGAI